MDPLKMWQSSNMCIEMTVIDQILIHEGIKSRINLSNVCYHSVQNLSSSCLLPKNTKTETYKTIILPVVLYGCATRSLILREECRLRVSENRETWKISGFKRV
jgi:hypothetical protein